MGNPTGYVDPGGTDACSRWGAACQFVAFNGMSGMPNINEFDILKLAFTPTKAYLIPDPEFPYSDNSKLLVVFGAIDILGLLNQTAPPSTTSVQPTNNGQPQNPTATHCLGQALAAKGLSIALDIAGAVPAFGNLFSGTVEGIQALNAGYYALANAGNTLLNPSASGAASTAATVGLTVASLALNGSKVIPVVGNLVSLGSAKAIQTYQQCMAGGG